MPIYAYACGACGFKKDVLQKLSDAPLTDCPSCGQAAFSKQLTAPGFVLKGSGWYVTDFREGAKKPTPAATESAKDVSTTTAAEPAAATAAPSQTPAPSAPAQPASPTPAAQTA